MMHLTSSILLALLLLLSNSGWNVNAARCRKDGQCTVAQTICALCVRGKGPACTTPICLNRRCGTIDVCSLNLSGNCTTDGDCIRNYLCKKCSAHKGPTCVTAKCFGGQCALIQPCTIALQKK